MACGGWDGNPLDIKNLETRLSTGIDSDRRYAVENAVKLRAVHSATTYEEFCNLVADKNEKLKSRPSIWNSFASKKSGKLHTQDMENSVYPTDIHYDLSNPPNTVEGLVQLWERLDLADRLDLLRNLSSQCVNKLTSGLVAGGFLGDVITTLLAFTPTVGDVVLVVSVLQAMIQAKRFSLSVQLVSGEERWAWGRLLEKLQLALSDRPQDLAEMNVTEWTLAQLKAKYNL